MINIKEEFSAQKIIHLLETKKSIFWENEQKKRSLKLFHMVSKRVAAYKDFLKLNKINPDKILTWEDYQEIPPIDKSNYLRKYSLKDLVLDRTIKIPLIYTATSGSTGDPLYFMRQDNIEWQCSVFMELFLKQNYDCKKTVLVVDCFGMGVWIGGIITYRAFEMIAIRNNLPVSVITPGVNKKEIFNILSNLAPQYDEVILAGYPPFIKDILDQSESEGIDVKKMRIRIKFAAESISEEFRQYVAKRTNMSNYYLDMINVYGSAELGAMATESSTSILIKEIALKNKNIFQQLFSSTEKTPTLAQYNPYFVNFESTDENLLVTGYSILPLIRYSIGDNGGIMSFDSMQSILDNHNVNFNKLLKKNNIYNFKTELPFVYVFERADLSTTFYGLCIYPEWIKKGLISGKLGDYLTGKFSLITRYDKKYNQYLEINLELRRGIKTSRSLYNTSLQLVLASLKSCSSEYRELFSDLKKKAYPKLVFWPFEDQLYFKPGGKHKWIAK